MTQERREFSNEVLTAYLDGELDASTVAAIESALAKDDALAAHLETLGFPLDGLRAVMDPDVLGAPEMPAHILTTPPREATTHAAPKRPRSLMPLALVASFLVGMVATTLIQPLPEPGPQSLGWTAAVASYQSLYVTETLSNTAQQPEATASVFARAVDAFDVALAPATKIDGIIFKRAQMLGFRGKPLLQLAYLADDGTPMALCLIHTDKPDRGTKAVKMFDLAGVSWVKDGVGYFLIGGDDAARVEDLSTQMLAAL